MSLSDNGFWGVGRAVADAVTKKVGSSTVTSFRLVTNRYIKKKGSDKGEEKATYIDCETWEKRAEYAAEKVKKGTPLLVTGRIESDEWVDKKTGEKRSKLKVYVEKLQVDTRGGEGGGKGRRDEDGEGEDSPEPSNVGGTADNDLPF